MPEKTFTPPILQSTDAAIRDAWEIDLVAAICERCDWRYLLPPGAVSDPGELPLCPHCFGARLSPWQGQPGDVDREHGAAPPEQVVPFALSDAALEQSVLSFAKGIPFAPKDLNFQSMRARLTPIYLPMWLADAQVRALWQAEAGFNYQVVSHQEHYNDRSSGWQSKQVREERVRWEPRVGLLDRSYHNVAAPALEEAPKLKQQLGDFQTDKAQPYSPDCLERPWVRLPDRSTQDAWSEAAGAFSKWAAGECQEACEADHLRQFRWKADFSVINWTLLLVPAYTTYYLDDDQQPQPVLIHGQTGRSTGKRRASMQRAQKAALTILIIALVLSVLGLVMGGLSVALPLLAPLAIIALMIGLPGLLAALIPLGMAWDFNRKS